jgi:predicted kinase
MQEKNKMEQENRLMVIITRGLPASGKTMYARGWVAEDVNNRICIEKDEIRKDSSLFGDGGYNHKRGDESIVIKKRDDLIHQALSRNISVVSSDTNLVQKHVAQISSIAKKYGAEVKIIDFLDVPLKELIERDSVRDDSVGEQVIRKMFHDHVKKMPTFVTWRDDLPVTVICDIDGTLAHMNGKRTPFEWDKVHLDEVDLAVAHILDGVKCIDYAKIILLSGRNEGCRSQTEKWLEKNDIEYDALFMREDGDMRDDTITKAELFEKNVLGKYNVLCVIDDRPKVCRMWLDVYGLRVMAVGDQRHEF